MKAFGKTTEDMRTQTKARDQKRFELESEQ